MNQLGYYGKTLHRGDFVRFNLPQSFVKVWDDWLQQVMISGESQSQTWPDQYAQAPSYRFVLSSGIAGVTPWIGVLKASQDKVGRRFPFCLTMSLPEHELPCVSVTTKALWFDEAEALMTRVLSSEYHFDDLQGELASMVDRHRVPASMTTNLMPLADSQTGDNVTISVLSSRALSSSQALPSLLDTVLQQTLSEYSLWMASGTVEVTAINAGLPINNAGLALFNGDWKAASTAHIDLDTLPSPLPLVAALPANPETESPIAADDSPPQEQSLDATLDSETQTVDAIQSEQPDTQDTVEIPIADVIEQAPSTNDWAALDDFADTGAVVVPDVEPLELDEDDAPDAPWER
ncbi:MAG: type VI secretion system protein ImpM [Granulosicoccus sp.]